MKVIGGETEHAGMGILTRTRTQPKIFGFGSPVTGQGLKMGQPAWADYYLGWLGFDP